METVLPILQCNRLKSRQISKLSLYFQEKKLKIRFFTFLQESQQKHLSYNSGLHLSVLSIILVQNSQTVKIPPFGNAGKYIFPPITEIESTLVFPTGLVGHLEVHRYYKLKFAFCFRFQKLGRKHHAFQWKQNKVIRLN